jgi:uncharacterized protein
VLFVIHIEEIRATGLDLVRPLPKDFVEGAVAKGPLPFQVDGPAELKGHLERRSGRVLFNGSLNLKVVGPCKRCLVPVTTPLAVDFALNFVKEDGTPREDGGSHPEGEPRASFELEDVDTEPFDGQRLVLDPLIEEQIVLALPMDVLCKPDCLGLCAVCGQDRNQVNCEHDQRPPDPRWAALKGIKLPN